MKGPLQAGGTARPDSTLGTQGHSLPGAAQQGPCGARQDGARFPLLSLQEPRGLGEAGPLGCGLRWSSSLWLACVGVQVTTEPGPLLPACLLKKHPAPAKLVCTHPHPQHVLSELGSGGRSGCTHPHTLSTSQASWAAAGGLGEPASSWAQWVPLRAVLPVTLRHPKGGQVPTHHPPLAEPQAGYPAMPSDHACRRGATFQSQRGRTRRCRKAP